MSHATVLAHGLFAHRRLPSLQALAESLARFGPVWTIDLRGHGGSAGACTLGELEADDIAAATAHARASTTLPIVTIGLSMGAAAAVRAAAFRERPDAVVAISGPAPWRARRAWGAWKTSLTWRLPGARQAAAALTGFRLSGQTPWGPSPLDSIAFIAPTPVLIVHGTDDPFFPPAEARALFAAAGEPKGLAIYPGGGHAESLFSDAGQPVDAHRVQAFANDLHHQVMGLLAYPTPDKPRQ
ncbi:MAG TPA: alpha/beta fold hydrolase [Actinomycetota bacterium]|nr:alpha/beta fold hydrolase [Actinomycetota bacterium]